jgi:hypothetical protein
MEVVMNSNVAWLSRFLWIVCAFHILVGLSLNVDVGFREWVGSSLYNAQVDWSDGQFAYIMKPLGAFMIALGVMAAMAARDPLANRSIIIGFAVLFTMRGLQRLLFMSEIERCSRSRRAAACCRWSLCFARVRPRGPVAGLICGWLRPPTAA